MKTLVAIIGDTWRQSKQQIVLFVLIGFLALFSIAWVIMPSVRERPDGEKYLTTIFVGEDDAAYDAEGNVVGLERHWEGLYSMAVRSELKFYEQLKEAEGRLGD
ncbi:MAG: hypothetical protein OEY28_14030, partial [Nitrospira sp.]|nr:hypothetical protein [Nitrospira sp.]